MNNEEKVTYYDPVRIKLFKFLNKDSGEKLDKMLGVNYFRDWWHSYNKYKEDNPIDEETKNKLRMLMGPNGYTIYKAMLARGQK